MSYITTLIIAVLVLLIMLPVLVLFYVLIAAKNAKNREQEDESVMSFEKVEQMFKSPNTSHHDLQEGVNYLIKHHIVIPQGKFSSYEGLVINLCKNRNVDKTLVLKLDRALNKANPQHNKSLAKVLKSALNARD